MVQIDQLRIHRNGRTICAVDELAVQPGRRVAVIGSNGSGKTTLLRVMAGLERHYEGACRVEPPRRQVVYVDQNPYLFRGSVLFNAMYGILAHGVARQKAYASAMQWLEALGVARLAGGAARHLSAGERRRTALARALAIQPALLLLDEPLAEIDDDGTERIRQVLRQCDRTTVIITSPTPIADGFVDTIHTLNVH